MKRKNQLITAATSSLAIVIIALVAIILNIPGEPDRLSFYHGFSDAQLPALASVIDQFERENENIIVELHYLNHVELNNEIYSKGLSPDIFLWFGPVVRDFPFSGSTPRRWMGEGWTLAVNRSVVNDETYEMIQTADNMEQFERALDQLQSSGITPLAVGNSHLWPLNSWAQHILISEKSVEDSYIPLSEDEKYRESWEILRRWRQKGFFYKESWDEGWPSGVAAMSRGEAAITLLSDKMLTAIAPEFRGNIEFLKFPQGNRKSWLVGAGTSIVINQDSSVENEAEKLRQYLTNPAVTDYLTFQMQRFFFSADDDAYSRHIASWQELANTPEMRQFGQAMKQFVEN